MSDEMALLHPRNSCTHKKVIDTSGRMRQYLLPLITLCLAGCYTSPDVTISTHLPGALIKVDGADVGRGPITQSIRFKGSSDSHQIVASRPGYQDRVVSLTKDNAPE